MQRRCKAERAKRDQSKTPQRQNIRPCEDELLRFDEQLGQRLGDESNRIRNVLTILCSAVRLKLRIDNCLLVVLFQHYFERPFAWLAFVLNDCRTGECFLNNAFHFVGPSAVDRSRVTSSLVPLHALHSPLFILSAFRSPLRSPLFALLSAYQRSMLSVNLASASRSGISTSGVFPAFALPALTPLGAFGISEQYEQRKRKTYRAGEMICSGDALLMSVEGEWEPFGFFC
jgi:hypothetical protein